MAKQPKPLKPIPPGVFRKGQDGPGFIPAPLTRLATIRDGTADAALEQRNRQPEQNGRKEHQKHQTPV